MKEEEINKILDQHIAKKTTEKEKAFLESWYNHQEFHADENYTIEERIEDSMLVWNSLNRKKITHKRLWPRIAVAASICMILGIGTYLLLPKHQGVNDLQFASYIKPGGNHAVLKLSNGKTILLDEAGKGELAQESGIAITKTEDGLLVYSIKKNDMQKGGMPEYNTISTPNGGKYQINLPDGSKVWLNAASSLKFPSSFAGLKERTVELGGEAYFEVSHLEHVPFTVKTVRQTVQVLGTHFNISAYNDDVNFKTTLLQGMVRVTLTHAPLQNGIVIKPGEQAVTTTDQIKINQVNTENVIDWKNDEFYFKDIDFKAAMRKIARWYDVEIIYDQNVDTNFEPGGWISRNSSISSVLKMMEATNKVHFKAEGRRITITK